MFKDEVLIVVCMYVGIHKVTIEDEQGNIHSLSRYYAMWNKPRPESSTIVCSVNVISFCYVLVLEQLSFCSLTCFVSLLGHSTCF